MKFLTLCTLLLFQVVALYATTPDISEIKQQPLKVVIAEAEKLYAEAVYEDAYYYYKALSEMKRKLSQEDFYRLGKTALAVKDYQTVQDALKSLLSKAKNYPLIHYEYASALKYTGQYVLAAQHFTSYLNANQNDSKNDYIKLAQIHLKACQKALKEKEKTSTWFLEDLADETAEEGTVYRALTKASKYKIGLIECQTIKGTCLKKVYPDNTIEPLQGSVGNPIFNSVSPHIAPDGETVYFAQQEMGKTEYSVFSGKMTSRGEIEHIKKLGPGVNRIGYSSKHPTIGLTEQGQEILYFASTLPGSQGGYDIWYAVRTIDGTFTMAYNLGTRVNGQGDEITPFYYQNDGELYFSSEKTAGYGGLDIYKMTGEKKRWKEAQAQHLNSPVNSKGNDFHFKKTARNKGSFSTDRGEGRKEKTVKYKKIIGA
ncbi:MAG: Tetratricopeptide repeat protein (Fragment) [uncultured Aureispira sp.]|uniref:Tetratricopeptide repeat protein n=1 Tax=uncultured Aureispira sp. TaxID=1331704 RepID=A0A6S6TL84_9BACT